MYAVFKALPFHHVILNLKSAILCSIQVTILKAHFAHIILAQSNFFNFFQTCGDFGISRKLTHIFLITHGKLCSSKVFHLEDINEIWLVMVTIIELTVWHRQLQYAKLLHTSKGVNSFNWNFKFTYLEWWYFKCDRNLNFEKSESAHLMNVHDITSFENYFYDCDTCI